MSVPGVLARLVAATVLAATGAALPVDAHADAGEDTGAGACGGGHGVVVVVDFHQLDHRDVRACRPDGGGQDAARLLRESGLTLTDVQRQPGFLCRVDGLPTDDPCVNTPPAGAYWSLWWSDPTSGRWTYSTVMASALEVPDGGAVGLVWDQTSGDLPPSVRPGSAVGSAAAAATTRSARPGEDGPAGQATQDSQESQASQALAWWVGPVAVAVLVAAAAAVAVGRRRRSAP